MSQNHNSEVKFFIYLQKPVYFQRQDLQINY